LAPGCLSITVRCMSCISVHVLHVKPMLTAVLHMRGNHLSDFPKRSSLPTMRVHESPSKDRQHGSYVMQACIYVL
jgi:hypothetical protein